MKGFYRVENKKLLYLIFFMTFARNRHCEKAFSADEASPAMCYDDRFKIAPSFLLPMTPF